jgi:protein-L-isoaspartate(D-aspartate) O-methyltransferase
MLDFAAARRMMVDGQVRTADVTDPRILEVMLELPRERFVPDGKAQLAYLDMDLPVGEGGARSPRRMLRPMVLAKLVQAAEVGETDRVLDIGCGAGYTAGLLARLAESVVALEEDEALLKQSRSALSGSSNVTVVAGPLVGGVAANGPYDVIVLEGATDVVPTALIGQLKEGGRLVCILGAGAGGKAMQYRLIGGELSGRAIFDAAAPLLPGFAKPAAFVF